MLEVFPDPELGREGFTWVLESGRQGTLHHDAVLDYNGDPAYLAHVLAHRIKVETRKQLELSDLSRREIIRRLGTSASQFYRLLDPDNTRTSLHQLLALLHVLGCEVRFEVKPRGRAATRRQRRGHRKDGK